MKRLLILLSLLVPLAVHAQTTTISALPAGSTPTGTEVLPADQIGGCIGNTCKFTSLQIAESGNLTGDCVKSISSTVITCSNLSGGILGISQGGTGASSFSAASLPIQSGSITAGDCVKWATATSISDAGFTCASAAGTVTSVALTVPSWLSVAGSPITTSGTLAVTAATGQTANQFIATPNGSSGAVSLRAIVGADLPLGLGAATPAAGQILVGNSGGTAYAANTLGGDCTLSSAGSITCTKTSGTAFGTFATQNYATPPAIGGTTPAAGSFTTLSASSTVSGTGFSTYLASPPAIGGTAAAAGTFTTLGATTFTASGAIQSLNVNSNFATNINTGTSTGTVSIGGGSGTVALVGTPINLNANQNLTTNLNTGSSTGTINLGGGSGTVAVLGTTTINASQNSNTSIGTGTSTGTVTIGGGSGTNTIVNVTSINANANNNTNINTGSSTGTANIGGGSGTVALVGTPVNVNANSNTVTNLNTGTSTGTVNIANGSGNNTVNVGNGTGSVAMGAVLKPVTGTTTVEPVLFTSGTNLTTPAAGAMEYDGVVPYFTPTSSSREVLLPEAFETLTSAYTLTSQTAAQKLLNGTTNGTITLPVGTFEFECQFSLTSMSATSGSFGFALGGTATFTQAWWSNASMPSTLATATAPFVTYNTAANTNLTSSTTTGIGMATINGLVRVTTAGTLIPQVSLTVAAAAVVGTNSSCRFRPIGAQAVVSVGNWS